MIREVLEKEWEGGTILIILFVPFVDTSRGVLVALDGSTFVSC